VTGPDTYDAPTHAALEGDLLRRPTNRTKVPTRASRDGYKWGKEVSGLYSPSSVHGLDLLVWLYVLVCFSWVGCSFDGGRKYCGFLIYEYNGQWDSTPKFLLVGDPLYLDDRHLWSGHEGAVEVVLFGSLNSLRGLRLGMPEWGSYAQKQNIYMPGGFGYRASSL